MLEKFKQFFLQFIIKFYLLDYVVKTYIPVKEPGKFKFAFKNTTFSFTRGALINYNLLIITAILHVIVNPNWPSMPWYVIIPFTLLVISLIINFGFVKNIPYLPILKYGDFTQIVGLDTYIKTHPGSLYNILPEDKFYYKEKVSLATDMWRINIDNTQNKFFNGWMTFMYPPYIVIIWLFIIWLAI